MRVWPRSAFLSNGIIRIEHHWYCMVLWQCRYSFISSEIYLQLERSGQILNPLIQENPLRPSISLFPPMSNQIPRIMCYVLIKYSNLPNEWMNHLESNLRETIRSKDRTAFIIIIIIICICLSFHMKFDNSISNSKLYNTVPAKIE